MKTKLLLISDTHDNMNSLSEILKVIENENIDVVIHCGDHVSPFSFNRIANKIANSPKIKHLYTTLGNNEGEIFKITSDYLTNYQSKVTLSRDFILTKMDNISFLITHGWGSIQTTRTIVQSLGKSGDFKFIVFGHTHIPELTFITYDNESLTRVYNEIPSHSIETHIEEYKSIIINPGELSGWLSGRRTYVILELVEKNVKIIFRSL